MTQLEDRHEKRRRMTKTLLGQVKKKMREVYPFDPRIRFHEQLLAICGALVATVYMVKGSERPPPISGADGFPHASLPPETFGVVHVALSLCTLTLLKSKAKTCWTFAGLASCARGFLPRILLLGNKKMRLAVRM
jgi:hypothetical protein